MKKVERCQTTLSWQTSLLGCLRTWAMQCRVGSGMRLCEREIGRIVLRAASKTSFWYGGSCRKKFREYIYYGIMIRNTLPKFIHTADVSDYNLRETQNIHLPTHRLCRTADSCYIQPLKLYNHLPATIKEIRGAHNFKLKIRKLLRERVFFWRGAAVTVYIFL